MPARFKQRPDVGTPPATDIAGELGIQIREPNVIAQGADHYGVRAFEVAAVDDQPGRPVAGPHLTRVIFWVRCILDFRHESKLA